MLHGWRTLIIYWRNAPFCCNLLAFLATMYLCLPITIAVVVPNSNCYALDNNSRLVDFTDWIGQPFEYDGKDSDLVVRFCKDVERRSQAGYVDFGRFTTSSQFIAGSKTLDFIQRFYYGDLTNCEQSFDKLGRTAQVNIICGNCLNGACKGDLGCICSVTYDKTMCRVVVELAIPCAKRGSRVFKGFTMGFNPRSWEVVYNGMTQLGFEKSQHEFSFGTEQTHVSLYLTAVSAFSGLVGKPVFKVTPERGLEVKISGSGASGSPPTTLSPTILHVNWRCETARDEPYGVDFLIPVEGYDPIEFTLTKICGYGQGTEGDAARGWAIFGILSCIFIVLSTIFCCGGFIYKTRVQHLYGLDALPGMTLLSACLQAVNGPRGYIPADTTNGNFVNQASWERPADPAQATQRANERRYGSM
ncbi:uncharacterized protein LOC109716509 isoform X2 [Ananas comosus]|uniref:Uncharacterized protein LOC109716509 isoform X2 n=1 Tax=Ananas comosus TaxID=4615 RepID=A0A6P5FPJ4_ANACO|nr:uncharacterized protein LOC109716509 isoform X2 [Ananas comosus]XP_020097588.1 uncharacterized protein LOC109716509 isoform X2 [Ananas comosus]